MAPCNASSLYWLPAKQGLWLELRLEGVLARGHVGHVKAVGLSMWTSVCVVCSL